MRKLVILSAILLIGISSCTKKNALVLTNPLAIDRPDETIIVKRADLEAKVGVVPEGFAPVLKLNGQNVPSQADDLNGDGKWDELAFVVNFKASETLNLDVENVAVAAYPQFEKRTNVRLGILQPEIGRAHV